VLIIGYYEKKNYGDDLFKYILYNKFEYFKKIYYNFDVSYEFEFRNLDNNKVIDKDVNLIILGGGDTINGYFMDSLLKTIYESEFKGSIFGFSVGVPYENNYYYTDIFDYLVVRTQYDYFKIKNKMENVSWCYDMVHVLPNILYTHEVVELEKNKINIGIYMANTFSETKEIYDKIIYSLCELIDSSPENYLFYLIPFCENNMNPKENDNNSNNLILNTCKNKQKIILFKKLSLYLFSDNLFICS